MLDVRDSKEFDAGHIVDAVNVPHSALESRLAELEKYKEKPVTIVCKMGQHAGTAGAMLRKAGFASVSRLSRRHDRVAQPEPAGREGLALGIVTAATPDFALERIYIRDAVVRIAARARRVSRSRGSRSCNSTSTPARTVSPTIASR